MLGAVFRSIKKPQNKLSRSLFSRPLLSDWSTDTRGVWAGPARSWSGQAVHPHRRAHSTASVFRRSFAPSVRAVKSASMPYLHTYPPCPNKRPVGIPAGRSASNTCDLGCARLLLPSDALLQDAVRTATWPSQRRNIVLCQLVAI